MTAEHDLTRRRLIGAGATASAGALLLGVDDADAKARRHKRKKPRKKAKSTVRSADVCVVGAGLAGLTTARAIAAAGKSVIVLEARDRVGGRVWNHDLGGGEVSERGGTFVGATQDRIAAMAKLMGADVFDTYDTGENVYLDADGGRSTFSDTAPTGSAPNDPAILPELTLAISQLDDMSTRVPVLRPYDAPQASEWDSMTLDSWVRANSVSERFRALIPAATRPIFGAEPRELSLLYTLFYIASSGNESNPGTFERNFNTRMGGQMSRVVGGSQVVPNRMAAALGRAVVLSSPVRRITRTSAGATVLSDRYTVKAKRVVVALPPTLAGRIDYEPGMPTDRDQLTQRLHQGQLTKVTAVYDRPFWRDKGLTGQLLSTDGLVSATYDDSPPSGTPGLIFGFVGGDKARAYARLSDAEKKAQVVAEFAQAFGPEAASPVDFFDTVWAEEQWSRGCPVAVAGPGVLTGFGHALREPVGPIHWAGTETSDYWNGYMDGAVRSGERVAREVLAEV